MAMGPKAMGEAIIANLKAKSGKDLGQWRAELESRGIADPAEARLHLRAMGLGQFQALAVVEQVFAVDPYADERRLVDDQFKRYPEQRALYEAAVSHLSGAGMSPKPCRGYLPIYRDGHIAISFKATSRGLYAALNLVDPTKWPEHVAHKPSLGGSARLKDGIYIADRATLERVLGELK
jgi:hypothetical protein